MNYPEAFRIIEIPEGEMMLFLFAIFRLFFDIPTPTGKNDGSVRGERYFTCPRGHELFIRENNITRVLSQPATRSSAAKAAAPAATTKTTKSCPSSVITTTSTIQTSVVAKRQPIATSSSP
ncbi:hypothetical protein HBH86_105760 [Parastagonospora nodorum]|nr:hypothetical protein HBH86_105760 [Parastagonospora nodorum]